MQNFLTQDDLAAIRKVLSKIKALDSDDSDLNTIIINQDKLDINIESYSYKTKPVTIDKKLTNRVPRSRVNENKKAKLALDKWRKQYFELTVSIRELKTSIKGFQRDGHPFSAVALKSLQYEASVMMQTRALIKERLRKTAYKYAEKVLPRNIECIGPVHCRCEPGTCENAQYTGPLMRAL